MQLSYIGSIFVDNSYNSLFYFSYKLVSLVNTTGGVLTVNTLCDSSLHNSVTEIYGEYMGLLSPEMESSLSSSMGEVD